MEVMSNVKMLRVNWKHLQSLPSCSLILQKRLNEGQSPFKSRSFNYQFVRHKTGYGTGIKARVEATFEEGAERYLEENNLKPKEHPGIFHLPKVTLPERFRYAAELILRHENLKSIRENAEYFKNYLWCRQLPTENQHHRDKALKLEEEAMRKDEAILPFLSQDETIKLNKKRTHKVLKELKRTTYHWEPINYSRQRALEYLLVRTAPEYAALCRIFNEISKRDPEFMPKTLCDFGSGLGTVTWAARTFWKSSLVEHLCADMSWEMNDLAELLIRGGNRNNDHPIPALFFRHHLPASNKIRYDLVVSSFSLMELPSAKDRLVLIDKLWNKTEDFLIIVEPGTLAGFRAIIEARNYVLGLGMKKKGPITSHVFSPCPNNKECPRFSFDNIPCNFDVKYRPLYPFHLDGCDVERFCYVVLRRGNQSYKDPNWPRLIEDPMIRTRHIVCRTCTKTGDIVETVLTKAKHSQQLRLVAKRSIRGDLLPIKMEPLPPTNSIETDEETENPQQFN